MEKRTSKKLTYSVLGIALLVLGFVFMADAITVSTDYEDFSSSPEDPILLSPANPEIEKNPSSSLWGPVFVAGGVFLLFRTRQRRKGQAAMEFLMTYGWAILAAIIAIGVLAYFGVFSPGQYVGSSAVVTAPFYAEAWNVQAAQGGNPGTVNVALRNNGGEDLDIQSVSLSNVQANTGVSCTPAGAFQIESSKVEVAAIQCDNLEQGTAFRADVVITYQKLDSDLDLTSTGTITDTVAANTGSGGGPGPMHQLSVTKTGNGQGTVTSSPSGINCGGDCSEDYNEGSNIQLTASATITEAEGSAFVEWSNACSGSSITCDINNILSGQTATARFGINCQDSDGGRVGSTQGTVTAYDPDTGASVDTQTDECDIFAIGTVIEYYCSGDGRDGYVSESISCGGNACINGACDTGGGGI